MQTDTQAPGLSCYPSARIGHLPNPPPQGGRERALPAARLKANADDAALTPLSLQARALYEGRVVPVRALARLCGVSLVTLYYHVHKQGWRRRRSDVPRDLAKSERQKRRYRERIALLPPRPRGLKARDPDGQARAFAAAERAGALAGAALAKAIARQDAQAQARMLALLTRALRDLAIAKGLVEPRPVARVKRHGERKPRRRPYQWRPAASRPPGRSGEGKRCNVLSPSPACGRRCLRGGASRAKAEEGFGLK